MGSSGRDVSLPFASKSAHSPSDPTAGSAEIFSQQRSFTTDDKKNEQLHLLVLKMKILFEEIVIHKNVFVASVLGLLL
jgi:hypothetical protein